MTTTNHGQNERKAGGKATTMDTRELVTISVAARALGINRKTVYKYIERGQLTRIDEGGRGYIPADQVRALREQMKEQVTPLSGQIMDPGHMVTVERAHYDALLLELGQLKAQQKLLLDQRELIQRQASELEASRGQVAKLEADLVAARRPWWKRLLS